MKEKLLRMVRCFAVAAVVAMLWMPVQSFAVVTYNWKIPSNVRIVQTDTGTVDNIRIFSSIQAAINSITDASATNRYVVKVMPGVYNEPTGVVLKAGIDINGSGRADTQITTTSNSNYTVQCATDNNISGISITYAGTSPTIYQMVSIPTNASVTFNDVELLLPNTVFVGGITSNTSSNIVFQNSRLVLLAGTNQASDTGIYLGGTSNITVNGCEFIMNNQRTNVSVAIVQCGGNVTTRNTTFDLTSYGGIEAIDGSNFKMYNSTVKVTLTSSTSGYSAINGQNAEIDGCDINITGGDPVDTIGIQGGNLKIRNSRIVSSYIGVQVNVGPVEISNSVISGNTAGIYKGYPNTIFSIGNSELVGGHNGVAGTDKVINCYDGNYNPIPNQ